MKNGNQGGVKFDRGEYLDSVGMNYDPVMREFAPEHALGALAEYLEAQDKWGTAVQEAADAEQQYLLLMGQGSRDVRQRGTNLFPEHVSVGYGSTLAAQAAKTAEGQLRTLAEDIAERADEITTDEIERAVWQSLGGSRHSHHGKTQLDMLGYASEAIALIEAAKQRSTEPIIFIERRVGESARSSSVGDPSKVGRSSVVVGDGYETVGREGKLDLVIKKPERVKFEEYRHVTYGGRPGLYGSAKFEQVWAREDAPMSRHDKVREMRVEREEEFVVPDILRNISRSRQGDELGILRRIAGSIALEDQLLLATYDMSRGRVFSGHGEESGSSDGLVGVHVGQGTGRVLEALSNFPDVSSTSKTWLANFKRALEVIEKEKSDLRKTSLLQRVGIEATTEEFYR